MLRVIAGKYGGRKLDEPYGDNTRPTMDRIKEAIFSSIHFDVEGSIIIDLFSGSGSMAIEAVSRGAMKAFAIDNNREAIKTIHNNVERLQIENMKIIKTEAISFLKSMKGTKFDFVFMDPPYENIELYDSSLALIKSENILNEFGLIIVETDNPRKIKIPEGFVIQKEKKYANTTILYIANNI
ncbi:MAG: 16S rRNA (guanine(966)-N(2))-methyltransferase RsmD [Mycoplasmataceae bacterium]|nr:16S rRNA (guanine(966)-N(2))-methyltransferase RsmD [Mycoplasmataceae bacterium]